MNRTVIGLGSNIEPEKNIQNARTTLAQEHCVLAESRFIVTKPVGEITQPDFINGTVLIETDLTIEQLKPILKKTEIRLGRKEKHLRCGPREIDLDIVTWNQKIIDHDLRLQPNK